ncbi:MAG: proline--tRNA ligase [Planctomycetota bacterium]
MTQTAADTDSWRSTARRGDVQRWSRTLIKTAKEPPADAEAISHKLLVRAGFIRRVGAGIYDYLPLGWRVLRKVSQIIRHEMDAAGASEILLPAIVPMELFHETGRADEYGELLFRLTDRHGRNAALGPTHEEVITEAMRGLVSSYKDLPLSLYQIQTKFRDEFRPRAGLLRGREFLMKDAYSFTMHVEGPGGLDEQYDAMYRAYENIFTKCALDFSIVEAESGPIGGSASHEFMVNADSGEDTILRCPETNYAANVEKCELGERYAPDHAYFAGDPTGDLTDKHTPDCPGIDEVCTLLKIKPRQMLKSVVFEVDEADRDAVGATYVIAVVRGDHDVNEARVRDALGGVRPVLADAERAKEAGFAIGYVSPVAAVKAGDAAIMLIDRDAAQGIDHEKGGKPYFWVTGADQKDHHVTHFNWLRDLGADPRELMKGDKPRLIVTDVRNAMAGDPSPRAQGAKLEARRGIEVGHIFKLGTKYSEAMGFAILDENQERRPVIMGCYGIGVSRTVAACVEMSSDDHGIIWPFPVAPYHALIVVMKPDDANAMEHAERIANDLSEAGLDVLIDDRAERPGSKFKDADLIGVPIRLTLGDKALAENSVEFKLRRDDGKGDLVPLADVVAKCVEAVGA